MFFFACFSIAAIVCQRAIPCDLGVEIPTPTGELKAAVSELDIRSFTKNERARLSTFYLAFADVVGVDNGEVISKPTQLRKVNRCAGTRCFGTDLADGHEGVASAIDLILSDAFVNGPNFVSDAMRAIAWRFSRG